LALATEEARDPITSMVRGQKILMVRNSDKIPQVSFLINLRKEWLHHNKKKSHSFSSSCGTFLLILN
jgi:hypothetical protein